MIVLSLVQIARCGIKQTRKVARNSDLGVRPVIKEARLFKGYIGASMDSVDLKEDLGSPQSMR